jgi:hypothetical protein
LIKIELTLEEAEYLLALIPGMLGTIEEQVTMAESKSPEVRALFMVLTSVLHKITEGLKQ